ncbi:MAG: pyrroloquinoline quinone biosynthesis protein PqqE [Alphaproteobacteria bacterium]|nr:pyrroloquinoline quinone biosynthesis protein PqqE [Alphaproteobacteria bacterium]
MNEITKHAPAPAPTSSAACSVPLAAPIAVLAELTHRCPLQCPYCSNPLMLEKANVELKTEDWQRVFTEAAALGVLQVHFSGGEPTLRTDLAALVKHANGLGLYTNLITSGVLLDAKKLAALVDAGLDHVQLSFQDSEAENANRIGHYKGGHEKKVAVAALIRAAGLPLTMNAVVHRQNLDHLAEIIALADKIDASRLEVAHVQYYGWALKNRAALMPTRAQLDRATAMVDAARIRLKGRLVIDYVVPDYYAKRPKKCMDGWGRHFFNVSPAGKVLPCHAAESIDGLKFDSVRERSVEWIWANSEAFNRFRGTDWMPEPCRSCDRRELDFGGCRCQAFALTGSAGNTDPACELSSNHQAMFEAALADAASGEPNYVYRRIGGA